MHLRCLVVLALLTACGEKQPSSASSSSGAAAAASGDKGKATTSAPAAASAAPKVAAPPSDVPSAAASANVTLNGVDLDGVKLSTVSCQSANANPFAALGLLSPVAKQKPALDACVGAPTEVRVHFSVAGKKASDIRVAGAPTPEAAACIAKALEAAPWAEDLVCVVKLDLKAAPAAK